VAAGRPYTQLLWWTEALPAGFTAGPFVPAGRLWVVRDIVAYYGSGVAFEQLGKLQIVEVGSDRFIGGVGAADAKGGTVYNIETRQVLNAGEQLGVFTGIDGWLFTISGYDFLEHP